MSYFQNGGPNTFEGNSYSPDHIHQAFEESQGNGLRTNTTMNGMNGMNGFSGFSMPGMGQYEDDDHEYRGEEVTDYTTEVPDEEGEGLAYNIEKRHIRETVDLADAYVFAWGDGAYGKLGQQSTDTLHVPYFVAALQKMPIRMCALGKQHTLFLTTEGYVLSCGSNSYGQLGTGEDTEMRSFPILIQTLNDIKSIASGHYHCLAVANTGKVHTWGSGSWGKLGLASDANQRSPRMIASIQSSIVETVSCGSHHSVAITATGDVWTWGKGARGQLGHNSVKEEYSPRLVAMLRKRGAERVRCGDDHTLVLLRNGDVLAFGANAHGQLGLGDLQDRGLPMQIVGGPGFDEEQIADMACCGNSSLVLSNTGKVYMFGDAGKEAKDNLANFRIPQLIKFLPKGDPITAVGRSGNSCFAVSDTGNLFRWTLANAVHADSGDDSNSLLESMHAIRGVVRIYCGVDHMAVICTPDMGCTPGMITRDKATSFSTDVSKASLEKLPDDTPNYPIQVIPEFLDDIAADTIMESPSREGDGYFLTYGKGVFGRLGHGMEYTRSEESTRFPKRVETLSKMTVAHMDCGKDSTAAITDTGKLYMWGKSVSGKLGLGPNLPQSVVVPRLVEYLGSKVVVRVSLGRNHSACLTDEHRFFTWGSNTFGQLGIPSITTNLNHPEEISALREANIRHFSCGGWHTIVCAWNGWVLTCGKGWHGQLGQGDYESLTARAKTLPYFKRIGEGGFGDHVILKVYGGKEVSAALSEAGRVFTWGQGDQCQLGHDSTNNEQVPRELEALSRIRIVDVALGESHMVALDEMGVPYSWGKGANGQLGHGELGEKQRVPRAIELCRRVTKSSSGFDNITKDIKWGSFFFQKTKEEGEEEEKEKVFFQRGKVVMVAAEGNYSMFVLERKANKMEIKNYQEAERRGHHLQKKMTEETVIRELFGCGSGKGGVLQNVGKESEYLPKLLPDTESGDLLQDVIAISTGKAHVGILIREDPLKNVEANNIKLMVERNEKANLFRLKEEGSKERQQMMSESAQKSEDPEEEERDMAGQNPFAMEVDENLKSYLESIPVFDAQKWFQRLKEADVDLETLSSLKEEELKECGISAIGARRRLLKEIPKLPNRYPPVFYAYQNSDFFYISWPPNRASEIAETRKKMKISKGTNVFEQFMQKKASGKIFRCLVRYAEGKHFESIQQRANLRYQVDAEGTHRLFTWGTGLHGRLGHGYGISFAQPKEVTAFQSNSKIVEVACGCEHTIVRTYDGTVLAFGNGDRGQLGVTENFHGVGINILMTPQQINGLKRFFIVQIAAGRWHNMALTSDRLVYVWGAGHFGQLGLDSDESRGTPVQLKCFDNRAVCKLLCGGWHSAAINESGKMFAWGKNTHGQLGLSHMKSTTYPKIIPALRVTGKVRTAALGANHTIVVMVENIVFAFGEGGSGQLGLNDGQRRDQLTPVEIPSLKEKNIFQVAAGDQHSMALSVFGEVWAWGGSPFGQLGHGGIMDVLRPMPLLERHNIPINVKSIAAGYTFSMALTKDGEVYSWGQGESGELGHAPKVLVYAPMAIAEFTNVQQLACGHRHAAAVQFTARTSHMDDMPMGGGGGGGVDASKSVGESGHVSGTASPRSASTHTMSRAQSGMHSLGQTQLTGNWASRKGYAYLWGEDSCGQLGMRGLQAARSPTLLQGLSGLSVVHVAANSDISAYVTESGSVYVSGSGDEGRLGLGHLAPAPTPLEVTSIKHHKIVKIACGQGHTVVLSEDRKVYAWGEGTWGNCGVANSSEVLEPQELHSLASADTVSIYAGGFHSAAITSDGSLYTWGKNANGQLGHGTVTMAEESPRKVESIGAIIGEVALGRNHTAIMAQVTAPNLYTCGMNANGQLGHDDFVDRCDPTAVDALNDRQIVSVGAGSAHTACVSGFGDLITFGNGRSGQLGVLSGVDADQPTPQQLHGFSRNQLVKVVCGQELTGVITDHGEVFLCGRESSLGLGGASGTNLTNPTIPKEVEGLNNVAQLALGSAHAIALTFSTVDTGPDKNK